MRIHITNCKVEQPKDSKEFCLSFDADNAVLDTDSADFETNLASLLRDFSHMIEAPTVEDRELF